jgi:hypothetical protein
MKRAFVLFAASRMALPLAAPQTAAPKPEVRERMSACQVLALEADASDFERAVKVQACPAGDLHAIATDCALHVSTTGTELLRKQRVLTQPFRPIWSQCAVYRAGCGVLIDADRRWKKSADVIHVTLAGSGNNRSADPDVQFGKSGNIGRERSHLLSLTHHHEVIARFHYYRRFQT